MEADESAEAQQGEARGVVFWEERNGAEETVEEVASAFVCALWHEEGEQSGVEEDTVSSKEEEEVRMEASEEKQGEAIRGVAFGEVRDGTIDAHSSEDEGGDEDELRTEEEEGAEAKQEGGGASGVEEENDKAEAE